MWTWKRKLLVVAAAGGTLACGGGDGTGPSVESLTGTWRATKAEVVSVANTSTRVELVGQGGTVRLVLADAKTFTLTVTMPGEPDDITTGTWSSSKDMMRLAYPGGAWECDMTLAGNTLSLGGADGEFDFDDDGVDEPAKWYFTLARQ